MYEWTFGVMEMFDTMIVVVLTPCIFKAVQIKLVSFIIYYLTPTQLIKKVKEQINKYIFVIWKKNKKK